MPINFSFILPGKLAGCARPGGWGDPRSDLAGLARQGIGAVVTLTEEGLDPAALNDVGLRSLHLPVADFSTPTRGQVNDFLAFVDTCLEDGLPVAVHCAAGIGRTGTMLACYLVRMGAAPAEAVQRVRSERPGSIETAGQERCVADCAKDLKARNKKRRRERK